MTDKMDKVRKLLSKAERASTTEEAEAFTAKATELMMRYHIDEALLAAAGEHTADELTTKRFVITGGYGKPKATLLAGIAVAFGARAVRTGSGKDTVMMVVGWSSDLEAIDVLFTSLLLQASNEAERERAKMPWVHGKTFMTSFLVGFTSTVYRRLKDMKRKTVAETASSTGTEIALYDRDRAVAWQYRREFPNVRSGTSSQVSSRAGFYSGKEAGNRADLGQSRLGGQKAAIGR